MGGENSGSAAVPVAKYGLPESLPCRDVEAGGRFVQEHEIGIADEGERDGEDAFLAAAEAARLAPPHRLQGKPRKQIGV